MSREPLDVSERGLELALRSYRTDWIFPPIVHAFCLWSCHKNRVPLVGEGILKRSSTMLKLQSIFSCAWTRRASMILVREYLDQTIIIITEEL
jgi:hypothetical protein